MPCCLAVSAALGGVAYLVLDLLPFPFNIGLLCVSPLLSLGGIKMVEQDASVVPAAFVPLAESRKRARLTPAYLAISAAYGIVFGLGIGSTTQIPGEEALYAGVAVFLLLGSGTAYAFLMRFANHALQTDSLRIMFPVLIIALIIALLNMTIKPILQLFGLPITVITLGIFYIIINTALLYLASWLANGLFGIDFIIATFGSGFVASIVISIVSSIMNVLLGADSYR